MKFFSLSLVYAWLQFVPMIYGLSYKLNQTDIKIS
jgi:hypothetical protein